MRLEDIKSIHRLSAIQEGILFHVMTDAGASAYIEHGICEIEGPLIPEAFEASWQNTIQRHSALRTAFRWNGLSKPVQIIYCNVRLPFQSIDCRHLSPSEQAREVNAVLETQREIAAQLEQAPLMRLALLRLEDERWQVVWSIHHLVHDAWSLAIIIGDVLQAYECAAKGEPMPTGSAPGYTGIVQQRRDAIAPDEETFWREYLRGFRKATPYPPPATGTAIDAQEFGRLERRIGRDATSALTASLQKRELTLNSAVLAAWAITLSARTTGSDVVFGCVTSGRSANIPGIDTAVGVFINTLPLRVQVGADDLLCDWLLRLQDCQAELIRRETTPLSQVQRYSTVAPGTPLFESLVVYQSAFQGLPSSFGNSLRIADLRSAGHPSYPLMLRVTPGADVLVELVFQRSRMQEQPAHSTLDQLVTLLKSFPEGLDRTVGEVAGMLKPAKEVSSRRGLGSIRPSAVAPEAAAIKTNGRVRRRTTSSPGTTLIVYESEDSASDLPRWLESRRHELHRELAHSGAILFRGFNTANSTERLRACITALGGDPLEYRERSSPRSQVASRLYTSTEYAADQPIFFHNENSYAHQWPRRIFFYCDVPPVCGGDTPIADVRSVCREIPSGVLDRFAEKGVLYNRNYRDGVGLSWQTVFGTHDRHEVESYCRGAGYEWEWLDGDRFRTRRVGPAVANHPDTQERIWFNHAAFFHISTLPEEVRIALLSQWKEGELPNQTAFGDGTPIDDSTAESLREAYRKAQLRFSWQSCDLLWLDNMLVAHARDPFDGPRRILVGMTDPFPIPETT